jgi:hypothetical protein
VEADSSTILNLIKMTNSIFTEKDFLIACDKINQINENWFGITLDTNSSNSFDLGFLCQEDEKIKATNILKKNIGLPVYGLCIYSEFHPYGF